MQFTSTKKAIAIVALVAVSLGAVYTGIRADKDIDWNWSIPIVGVQNMLMQSTATTQPPSGQILPGVFTSYWLFGDSISTTSCASASSSTNCYWALLANYAGISSGSIHNNALSGATAADITESQCFADSPTAGDAQLRTVWEGTNDALDYQLVKPTGGSFQNFLMTCLAYQTMATRTAAGAGTMSSGWSTDTHFSTFTGAQSTTNGATLTVPFTAPINTSGNFETMALLYPVFATGGGSVTAIIYTSGGGYVSQTSFNNSQTDTWSHFTTRSVGVAFLTTLSLTSGGSYKIVFTNTATTGATTGVYGFGFNPQSTGSTDPQVWNLGIGRVLNDGSLSQPLGYLQQASDMYNGLVEDADRQMQQMGFPVYWVNVRNCWAGTSADMGATFPGNPHPNNTGHAEIARCLEAPTATPKFKATSINITTAGYPSPGPSVLGFGTNIDPTWIGQFYYTGGGTLAASCSQPLIYLSDSETINLPSTGCDTTGITHTSKSFYIHNGGGTVTVNGHYNTTTVPSGVVMQFIYTTDWYPVGIPQSPYAVTCAAGTPSSSFQVLNGVVVHC